MPGLGTSFGRGGATTFSADPTGNPWPKETRLAQEYAAAGGPRMRGYVYWDAEQKRWVGLDVPDFVVTKAPDTPAKPYGVGLDYHDGASPFIMKADGKGWLYVPNGLVDGPLPTHYEPYESPVPNQVYKQQSNPCALTWNVPGNPYAQVADPKYPHVLSTYRLTEHHLSGTMSRWLPWLAELQPELFCEISPEHAGEIGIGNTDWVVISTPRGSIRAKALVTRRIRPYRLKDRTVHHVGLPWHWGYKGLTTGDVVSAVSAQSISRLQHADRWALMLELILFVIFLASLGELLWPVLQTWHGKVLVIGTLAVGILLPLVFHVRSGLSHLGSFALAAIFSLVGGFVLRYAILTTPPELLARGPEIRAHYAVDGSQAMGTPGPVWLPALSPEEGRTRGGGPGADVGNRTTDLEPRSKVFYGP